MIVNMWIERDIPDNLENRDKELFISYVGFANDYISYFGQYEKAINILIKYVYETKTNSTEICHPLLYLVRHSMELGIKANIYFLNEFKKDSKQNSSNSHNLKNLFNLLEKNFYEISDKCKLHPLRIKKFKDDSEIIKDLINILGEEPSVFRYPADRIGNLLFERTDVRIDILELFEKYKVASDLLSGLANTIWMEQQ